MNRKLRTIHRGLIAIPLYSYREAEQYCWDPVIADEIPGGPWSMDLGYLSREAVSLGIHHELYLLFSRMEVVILAQRSTPVNVTTTVHSNSRLIVDMVSTVTVLLGRYVWIRE